MIERYLIEKRAKKRAFEHAAKTYDAGAVLQREVAVRLAERLEYMKATPAVILDAGAGTGFGSFKLAARYPAGSVIALDIAQAMLAQAPAPWRVCGDIEQLPVKHASVGMVWSNLVLQWCNRPEAVFREVWRVLEPGGLYLFTTFGPDTLKELRAAWRDADTHINLFADMHDLGDLMAASGLCDPVMERETFTVTYSEVASLMRDLKAIGAQNATVGRRRGLTGRATFERVKANYESFRRDGKLPATFEVIYAHAWKPQARVSASGRPIIEVVPGRS